MNDETVIEILRSELSISISKIEELKSLLAPFSIIVVDGEGKAVKVGEVPNTLSSGDCHPTCHFVMADESGYKDICFQEWEKPGTLLQNNYGGYKLCKPGPQCPRGKKEDTP